MAKLRSKKNRKPRFTRRKDGRWQKKYQGKTYSFRTKAEAQAWWDGLTPSSAPTSPDGKKVSEVPLAEILVSPENELLYRPVRPEDPEIVKLAESIGREGVLEPCIITSDGYVVSGHRRRCASELAGLATIPCRTLPIRRIDDIDRFVVLLREHNRQREKTNAERLREELLDVDPHEAHHSLHDYRQQKSQVQVETIGLRTKRKRSEISDAKRPLLEAIKKIVEERRRFWPISERVIHYRLVSLAAPVLRNTNNPDSAYENTRRCSQDLSDLCVRARLSGEIPFEAIGDETRPRTRWCAYDTPREFIRNELNGFLKGYWRDLQCSQPNYLHIFGEKNTVYPVLKQVGMEFCVNVTSGRGFSSHDPIHEIAENYWASGKDKLILLVASDFDPSGECIAESFCRNLRDDYGVEDIVPVKFALTRAQIEERELPTSIEAKATDSRYKDFVARHGTDAYELEALDEDDLQQQLRDALNAVMDVDAFNREVEAEREDAAFLEAQRRIVHQTLREAIADEEVPCDH